MNELALIRRPDTYKMLLIIGYFLEKHGYVKNGNDASITRFFSRDNVKKKLDEQMSMEDKDFYNVVYKTIRINYRRYENIVYNVIGMNIEKIFQYKSPDDNTVANYSKMAADSDLRLKDYEVGLINEAFNLYADSKNRWLKKENDV